MMQFEVVRNDISNMTVDAMVLPSNPKLKEGRGTSKAIFEKAGRKNLEKACEIALEKYGNIYVGGAIPTLAYNLDAKFIIHAVVPKWVDGKHQEYEKLSTAYLSTLELADVMSCESIAFPLLASGNNGFDLGIAFEIAKESVQSFFPSNKLKKVIIVLYGAKTVVIARNQGIAVEEIIDDSYILRKEHSQYLPEQRVRNDGKNIAGKFLKDGLQMAKDYLDEPENRKKMIAGGIAIAKIAIDTVKKMI
jgi:O-acetyl-ADP-ribose deacetylase (regulator of RNase III)